MRLPNSYGSVYKLSGKRRNPWVARKTVDWKIGKNGEAQPVYKYIGYYPTRSDALDALAEYNKSPMEYPDDITLGKLYEMWSDRHYQRIKDPTRHSYENAWSIFEPYKDKRQSFFTLSVLQGIFDRSGKNQPVKKMMKTLLKQMYEYGEQYDLIKQNKVSFIDIGRDNPNKREKTVFTKDEIKTLWDHSEDRNVQYVLMLIYTGLRVGEFLALAPEDVHLEERWIDVRESKTLAGIRQVPIAEKVAPFFTELPDCTYTHFNKYCFRSACRSLGMDHSSHEARHTCVTLLTDAHVDARVIKQIVGHSGAGVTEQVYTHISLEEKLKAINRI